jgi:hypothetical protein
MTSFSNPTLDLSCPECNRRFRKRLGDLSPGKEHRCTFCGTNIVFQGDGANKTQKALKGLERTIDDLNRKLKL